MSIYFFKTILCAAVFLGAYHFFLEKEKLLRFNRAYLLLAVGLSFYIPLLTFTTETPVFPVMEKLFVITEIPVETTIATPDVPVAHVNVGPLLLLLVYILVTAFLLLRFVVNILRIRTLITTSMLIDQDSYKIVLVKEKHIPYSFLRYIFVNEIEYKNGQIEKEVLHHELVHLRQKHSIDIILLELVLVFLWINPILFLYRKAIQLNHEFLADKGVIDSFNNPVSYQLLLLNKIGYASGLAVSSSFNYKVTKKRLIMITKQTNKTVGFLKALAAIPVIGAAVFLFSERIIAQVPLADGEIVSANQPLPEAGPGDTTKLPPSVWANRFIGGTKEGASPELMKEYQDLIDKNTIRSKAGRMPTSAIPSPVQERLETIFKLMSREQQGQQIVAFILPPPPLKKSVPTKAQLESFADASVYGVWIDQKKVNNDQLSQYNNTDFSWVGVSKLYGRAKSGKKYSYQVNLYTNKSFLSQNEATKANRKNVMVIMVTNPGKASKETLQ